MNRFSMHEGQKTSIDYSNEDGRCERGAQPMTASDLACRYKIKDCVEEHVMQTASPREDQNYCTQIRNHSFNESELLSHARGQRLSIARRPAVVLKATTRLSTENASSARDTQVYSMHVDKAKCKNCFNIGHTPILRIRVHSEEKTNEELPSSRRPQVQRIRCCVCNTDIATSHSFNGNRIHLDVRDLLHKAVIEPRHHANLQRRSTNQAPKKCSTRHTGSLLESAHKLSNLESTV